MECTHIQDCWDKIREAKTKAEVEKLFGEFPRLSGDWDIQVDFDGADYKYIVHNYYYDYSDMQEDVEMLDIPVEEDDK